MEGSGQNEKKVGFGEREWPGTDSTIDALSARENSVRALSRHPHRPAIREGLKDPGGFCRVAVWRRLLEKDFGFFRESL